MISDDFRRFQMISDLLTSFKLKQCLYFFQKKMKLFSTCFALAAMSAFFKPATGKPTPKVACWHFTFSLPQKINL